MEIKKVTYLFLLIITTACTSENNTDAVKRYGNFRNRPRGFQSVYMPGGQIALFIENKSKEELQIEKVNYFVGDKGNFDRPFRVMLYSVDTITNKPLNKLLPDSIIVKSERGNDWFGVDLSGYNLVFSKSGFFVSMEWIPDDSFNNLSQTECQYIGYSKIKNENKTWYCALGINWYQLPNCDYNAMISMDVK